jgi:hypothetical protein
MLMLQTDPEFYRKVVGMMQSSKMMLKIEIAGNTMNFKLNNKQLGMMTTAEFYKMTVKEIWHFLGVSDEYRKRYLS